MSQGNTRPKTHLETLNTGGTESIALVGNILRSSRPAGFRNVHLGLGDPELLHWIVKGQVLTLLGTVAALAMLFSSKNSNTQSAAPASVVLANQA
jgi:hypothetical protein